MRCGRGAREQANAGKLANEPSQDSRTCLTAVLLLKRRVEWIYALFTQCNGRDKRGMQDCLWR
jgi:hypothetical protein